MPNDPLTRIRILNLSQRGNWVNAFLNYVIVVIFNTTVRVCKNIAGGQIVMIREYRYY